MQSINKVILLGRVRYIEGSVMKVVTTMRIRIDDTWQEKDEEHLVTMTEPVLGYVRQYVKIGEPVIVEGAIRSGTIAAERVTILPSARKPDAETLTNP
jgi:single-stranded DNA-binding protein